MKRTHCLMLAATLILGLSSSSPGHAQTPLNDARKKIATTSDSDTSARAGSPDAAAMEPYQSVITIGFSMSALATAAGVVMTVMANSRSQSAASSREDIQREYGATACDAAAQPDGCAGLDELLVDRDGFATGAVWSFVGAGALAIGTSIYTFVMAPKENAAPALTATPIATPQGGAIVLTATW